MSMLNEPVVLIGELLVRVFGPSGERTYHFPNLVVNTGKNLVASRLVGNTPAAVTHMALGSSATVPSGGDTQLGTELGRVAAGSATAAAAVATVVANFPAGTATGTIAEAGLFNAASVGTMISRATFSPIPKGVSDAVEITWTITVQ